MQQVLDTGIRKNQWMRRASGLYAPPVRNFPLQGCVLYLPLWHPDFKSTPITAWDIANETVHSCAVTGATWGYQGRTFDGIDNKIVIPDSASLNITATITLLVWVRVDTWAWKHAFANGYVFDKGSNASKGYALYGVDSTETFSFQFYDGAASKVATSNGNVIAAGVWGLIGGHYDGSSYWVSLNGVQSGSAGGYVGDIDTSAGTDLSIGEETTGGTRQFWGDIGEAWVYNRALSLAEIQQIYNATKWRYQ